MQLIADLQLHSKYSRAVSPRMDLFEIARWSARKGIGLVATGDWQHPLWFREITTHLAEKTPGIFALKKPEDGTDDIRFLLSSEISSIYSQNGKGHRIHNLIFSPSIQTCEKIIKELKSRGANLSSDGRPIIGISARDLAELVFTIDEKALIIPAHVWTPWFSLYGSMSGFDSIDECFGDMAKHIHAIETGLSSDPLMNWQIKELETRSILSFSDAHSGPKLGREATVFVSNSQSVIRNLDVDFNDVISAIKRDPKGKLKVGYTIEFFPEEGKYHWNGHRVCGIKYSPQEVKTKGEICPVCKKKMTIGVENRVIDLAYKTLTHEKDTVVLKNKNGVSFVYDTEKKRVPFVSLIPLQEIVMEIMNHSPTKSLARYLELTSLFGTEFDILLKKSFDEIQKFGGVDLRNAVEIVRNREVFVDPGFDGVFGVVKIFNNHEKTEKTKGKTLEQTKLF